MTPAVSVILPVYNEALHLPRCLHSLFRQTLASFEILVIDDGSTDETAAILESNAGRDRRLRLIGHAENRGIVAALNAGIDQARSSMIARMDADDICDPARLETQLRFFDSRPEIGVVGSLVQFVDGDRDGRGYAAYVDWLNSLVDPSLIELRRFIESPLAHPSVMFRKSLVRRFGGYLDGDFPEDYELWLRWLEAGVQVAKVDRPLLHWTDRANRLSRSDSRYSQDAFYRLKCRYIARWLNRRDIGEVMVWGAGRPTRRRAELLLDYGIAIRGYVDIDPRKCGTSLRDRPVVYWRDLDIAKSPFILSFVGVRGARDAIGRGLNALGAIEGVDYLFAA